MKDVTRNNVKLAGFSLRDVAGEVVRHLSAALLGFLGAFGSVLGTLMPFGLSVVGGVGTFYSIAAGVGAAVGYLVGAGSFRYLVCALAVSAIKVLLGTTFKNELKPIFSALCVGLVAAATGIVTVKQEYMDIIFAATEALLAASGAYFIARSTLSLSRESGRYTAAELSSFLISLSIIFTGLFPIKIADASLGRVLAAAIILLAARYGGVSIGAVCGTAFGFAAVLSGAGSEILLIFAFGGLIAGVFSLLNKYAVLSSFILSVFVSVALIGTVESVLYIVEAALGAAIFIAVPKSAGAALGAFLNPAANVWREGPKKAVTMRLNLAAEALSDVSKTVEQIASELSKINAPDFNSVLSGIEADACSNCALRVHCWETKKADTLSAVLEMTKAVKARENTPELFAPEEFRTRCQRPQTVGKAVTARYSDFAARISAENRIDEVRSVVSDQFSGISEMLKDLSLSIEEEYVYDNTAALSVAAALKGLDLKVCDTSCKVDSLGRMTVEARVKQGETPINRMNIMSRISATLDRDFDKPCVDTIGDITVITLSERTVFGVDIGVTQISADGRNMCGDAYNYFYDGRGKFVSVLSDGMGTGGRAAVDGAMASGLISRLLKAGFGYDCSLKILNSSMLFKSTDESLATVDIAVIDLYNGKTDLLKAGAAPSVVRRSGRTGKAESSSLPVGILREIGFDKATIKLKKGDILLMMSDGVSGDNNDWLCEELAAWGEGSAQQLSEHISALALRRRNTARRDDITVMAVILNKSF